MTKDEMKNKYSAFITEISEILGLGKPVDILKLCATTDLFFQPLEKRIAELEKENAELEAQIEKMKNWCNCKNYQQCLIELAEQGKGMNPSECCVNCRKWELKENDKIN